MKINEKDLWNTWKKTGNKEVFNTLVKKYKPVINKKFSELNNPAIPSSALKARIEKSVINSFKTFNPNKGAALNTYVFSRLPEVNKFVYKFQNFGRIPVNRIVHYNTFQTAMQDLKDKLKRDPDNYELADELQWNVRDVKRMRKEVKKDLLTSGMSDLETTQNDEYSDEDDFLFNLYFELNDKEKFVYNRLIGANGAEKMSNGEIAKALKVSNAMVTKIKNRIAKKAKKYQ